jgi:hypothetical protein
MLKKDKITFANSHLASIAMVILPIQEAGSVS